MLVSSVSSFNPNRVVGLASKRNEKSSENTAFAGLSTSTTQAKKMSVPVLVMLASMFLGILALVNCKDPMPTPTPTTTFVPTKTPGPTQTSGATAPPVPTVTQSPVQTNMAGIGKTLGLTTSSNDITSYSYSDWSDNTKNDLTLNTNESSPNELVYDGTSYNQDFETTSYIRQIVTESGDGGIIVKEYKTGDGNPPSATTTWVPSQKYKYILNADASGAEKYSLNPDDSTNGLLATISPDTESSLIVTLSNGDVYQILDIVLN